MCKIAAEIKTMDQNMRKEKSFVPYNHTTHQKKYKNGPKTTSISSQSSLYLKSNTTLLQSDNLKWNSEPTMRTRNLTSQNSLKFSDKDMFCNEKQQTKIWKKRKRIDLEKQNAVSLISKAYSQVIFPKSSYPLNIILYVSALLFIIAGAQAQTPFPGSNSALSASATTRLDNREYAGPEGFFFATNGSSLATLSNTLLSETSSGHFGLSFRTCTPGELLKQVGDNKDVLKVELTNEDGGKLHFSMNAQNGDFAITKSLGSHLLDAKWHTVLFQFSPQNDKITINISGTQDTHSLSGDLVNGDSVNISSQEVSDALRVLDLSRATSPQLKVGGGFIGCIREGPTVRFTKAGVSVNSEHVKWGKGGNCLLPNTCEGKQIFKYLNINKLKKKIRIDDYTHKNVAFHL